MPYIFVALISFLILLLIYMMISGNRNNLISDRIDKVALLIIEQEFRLAMMSIILAQLQVAPDFKLKVLRTEFIEIQLELDKVNYQIRAMQKNIDIDQANVFKIWIPLHKDQEMKNNEN